MKANELRIGNVVLNDRVENTIESINKDFCYVKSKQGNTFMAQLELIKPIPLTEEWLVKFGFEKHDSLIANSFSKSISRTEDLKELCVYIDSGNEYIHIRDGERSYPTTADIITTLLNGDYHGRPFYVHQIQNLYFALTGEELHPL